MAKLIILSIVIMSFIVPVWLSTAPRPRQGLRRTQWIMLVTICVWSYLCLHWYPQLVSVE